MACWSQDTEPSKEKIVMVIYGPPLGHDSVPETWKPSLNISDSNLTC